MIIDMTQLRAELRSSENDADDRERILLAAMRNVLLYHCKLGTWRGESIAAVDILHGAGFHFEEVLEYHLDAIRHLEADGVVNDLMAGNG